ncbi:hypothetical protein JCM17846_24740 [Iodidimonas nitroreducens]|uniref:Uncharacterized protein n=1 Tax=Iodidimonas nitroreducens TaxID=1236968 RepID=A0A5A7N8X2_9PROT|nr:hypothetical protein [Iodidimonas nitroreducens]GAK33819.1 hypothetical protein AQ1_01710 [alpha proteobacterium Q-1]GER04792.1 hypothetical protein JCM17846_24740 [Iodidimonas nitroreducens]
MTPARLSMPAKMSDPVQARIRLPRQSIWPALGFALFSLLLIGIISLWPPQSGAVAAGFPPHWSLAQRMQAVEKAEALVLGQPGPLLLVIGKHPDAPGLPGRLWAAGAMIVIDPAGATGCAGKPKAPLARNVEAFSRNEFMAPDQSAALYQMEPSHVL